MKFTVVGYKGEIGMHILSGLIKILPSATDIYCFDKGESSTEKLERIQEADVIFLCVPFKETVNWLETNKSFLINKVVVEQSSWKTSVYEWGKKNSSINIHHMHILYKPSITERSDRRVVLLGKWERVPIEKLVKEGLQASPYMLPQVMGLDDQIKLHDEAMAYQQSDMYEIIENYMSNYTERFGDWIPKTRNFGKIQEVVDRIASFPKDLREALDSNPYSKKVKGEGR